MGQMCAYLEVGNEYLNNIFVIILFYGINTSKIRPIIYPVILIVVLPCLLISSKILPTNALFIKT
jgi:hypothetical protein